MDIPVNIVATIIIACITSIPAILVFWRQLRRDNLETKSNEIGQQTVMMKAVGEAAISMLNPLTSQLEEMSRKYSELDKKYDDECAKNEKNQGEINKLLYSQKEFKIQLDGALNQLSTRSRRVTELQKTLDSKEIEWNNLLREKDEQIAMMRSKIINLENRVLSLEELPSNGIKKPDIDKGDC
jgi:small-conductance mechanosensitive channel